MFYIISHCVKFRVLISILTPNCKEKEEKYKVCNTILIEKIADEEAAILLQNSFPTLEKYIDHVHTIDKKPYKVPKTLENKIVSHFKLLIEMHNKGLNLFFTDIDKIKEQMLKEIDK